MATFRYQLSEGIETLIGGFPLRYTQVQCAKWWEGLKRKRRKYSRLIERFEIHMKCELLESCET